jgi:hypothetical protein
MPTFKTGEYKGLVKKTLTFSLQHCNYICFKFLENYQYSLQQKENCNFTIEIAILQR